jgi:transcriptional regulator with XRE-family HTH domain
MSGYDIERQAREFGEHLRGWRHVLGLTAQQVCERADIAPGTLRKLERGDTTVGLRAALQVARAVGILDELTAAADPLRSDLGRARARLLGRKRVG